MRSPATVIAFVSLALALAHTAEGAVVCARKNGALVLRDVQCRPKEREVSSLSGLRGPQGLPGDQGPPGAQGPVGPLTGYLPAGVTLEGVYALSVSVGEGDAGKPVYSAFNYGFEVPLVYPVYVRSSSDRTPECKGSPEHPTAAPGTLCLYEWKSSNAGERGVCWGDTAPPDDFVTDTAKACPGTNSGGIVFAVPEGSGLVTVLGMWAVTGY